MVRHTQTRAAATVSPHTRWATVRRGAWLGLLFASCYLLLHSPSTDSPGLAAFAQDKVEGEREKKKPVEQPDNKSAAVINVQVPLPLTGNADQLVQSQIDRALKHLPANAQRPTLILEFRPQPDTAGEGSDFGRAHSLARFLESDALANVKTVAWLPNSVQGHAVLPVLACEQIIMAKDAELGAAGVDEKLLDETMRGAYREFSERRRTVPTAVAAGFLDDDLDVTRVVTPDGVRFETKENLEALRKQGVADREETIFRAGEKHLLNGAAMRSYGFATHLADDRTALAAALGIPLASLRAALMPDSGWRPIRVDIDGPVTNYKVNWVLRVVEDHQRRKDFNLLCIYIHSAGGNPVESLRLAQKIAEFPKEIRTVAIIQHEARADAGVIAWACDDLIMWPGAQIGGEGDGQRRRRQHDRDELQPPLDHIAKLRQRTWSLPLAMIDKSTEVWPYQRAGSPDRLYFSVEEWEQHPEKESWEKGGERLNVAAGLSAQTAAEIGLATHIVQNDAEFKSLYHLDGELPAVRSNWALEAIEWLADPKLSAMLLFVAMFALMIEFSSPGVGLPGFIALVCFVLFFWSNFLHGNATGLEICLFVVGVLCVLIEVFVAPGTFVFGIGGGLMIVSSIILASQTFVLPTNTYQLRQMPISLGIFVVGLAGGVVAVGLIRRFLPDTPYFNKMILKPPQNAELEERQAREQLVAWTHLSGKRGMTTTALFPSGKALIGDQLVDVMSAGEMIEKGKPVIVLDVIGSRVLVREA